LSTSTDEASLRNITKGKGCRRYMQLYMFIQNEGKKNRRKEKAERIIEKEKIGLVCPKCR